MTGDQPPAFRPAASDDPELQASKRKFDRDFWRITWLQLGGIAILFAVFTWFDIAHP